MMESIVSNIVMNWIGRPNPIEDFYREISKKTKIPQRDIKIYENEDGLNVKISDYPPVIVTRKEIACWRILSQHVHKIKEINTIEQIHQEIQDIFPDQNVQVFQGHVIDASEANFGQMLYTYGDFRISIGSNFYLVNPRSLFPYNAPPRKQQAGMNFEKFIR